MKIYANNQDYSLIDQYAGTNIWVSTFYCDDRGPNVVFANILSRNGDIVTFKEIAAMFISGDVTDDSVWEFAWSEQDVYNTIQNFDNYGSGDQEIHQCSISEDEFSIYQPTEILTTNEINDIIETCYGDIIQRFEE